jgi:flagellar hook-associated protein 2
VDQLGRRLHAQRREQNDQAAKRPDRPPGHLQTQFDSAYKRYLAQFTALQQLQSSMTSTSNMFTAMFSQ